MIRMQVKEMVCSPAFVLTTVGFALLMLFQGAPELFIWKMGRYIQFRWENMMVFSFMGIIEAIPPVIPLVWFCTGSWEGSTYHVISRSGKRRYYLGRISSAILTGMLVVLVSCLLYCAVLALAGCPLGNSVWAKNGEKVYSSAHYAYPLYQYLDHHRMWWATMALNVFSHMAFGAVCCMITLALTSVTDNRYVLLGAPFLWTLGGSMLSQFLYQYLWWINPLYMKLDYQTTHATLIRTLLYFLIASSLMGICYWKQTERRLRDG